MEKDKIERINELAKQKKESTLTHDEQTEHEALRKEYIAGFRANMEQVLSTAMVQQEDGTLTPLQKKRPTNQYTLIHP